MSAAPSFIPFPESALPQAAVAPQVQCPNCRALLQTSQTGPLRCPSCGTDFARYVFNPLPITVENSEQALPDDATCMHHPTKRATAVCAGTGDYICALCAVDLEGQTFSAAYLNTAGKAKAKRAFDKFLDRPDSAIISYILFCFLPYVNCIVVPLAIIWVPYGYFLYAKALRARRENTLFARVMTPTRVVVIPIALILVPVTLWLLIILYAYMIGTRGNRF